MCNKCIQSENKVQHKNYINTKNLGFSLQLTLYPSKTKASSSVPSSTSGLHPGLAQPTRMSPPVTASNSKYHFPVFTAYVLSTLKKRILSMLRRSAVCPAKSKETDAVRIGDGIPHLGKNTLMEIVIPTSPEGTIKHNSFPPSFTFPKMDGGWEAKSHIWTEKLNQAITQSVFFYYALYTVI